MFVAIANMTRAGLGGRIGTRCGEKPTLIKGVGGREELVRLTPSRNVNK